MGTATHLKLVGSTTLILVAHFLCHIFYTLSRIVARVHAGAIDVHSISESQRPG